MLPGHTKFKPDSYFGLFKKYYRVQNSIDTLEELVRCVRRCRKDVTCVPQICSDWSFYNWDAMVYSIGWDKQVSHLSFHKDNPGLVLMKQTPYDEGREMNLLEKGVKIDDIVNAFNNKEMPPTILPKGLTKTRAQYL